jgi:hypothetical protein
LVQLFLESLFDLYDRITQGFTRRLEESLGDGHELADGVGQELAANHVTHPTSPHSSNRINHNLYEGLGGRISVIVNDGTGRRLDDDAGMHLRLLLLLQLLSSVSQVLHVLITQQGRKGLFDLIRKQGVHSQGQDHILATGALK